MRHRFRALHLRLIPVLAEAHRRLSPPLDLNSIAPILVLGNQKTGSSAIAGLLAARTGSSMATDLSEAWTREFEFANDRTKLVSFIDANRYYFRRTIVKENSLTLAASTLFAVIPNACGVFVVRHPVQNIRSILDRLDWPGDPRPIESLPDVPRTWQQVINVKPWGTEAADHISALAHRWRLTTEAVIRNRARGEVVRYEDFNDDKLGTIDHVANQLGLPNRLPVGHLLEHPFQPRGTRRGYKIDDVFSEEAVATIERICSDGMADLGYESVRIVG